MTDIDYNVAAQGLRDQIARFTASLAEQQAQHEADIQTISDALLAEADRRNWCDEYDTMVSNLNNALNRPLPERQRTYKVVEWYTVERTMYVDATNASTAAEHPLLVNADSLVSLDSDDYGSYTVRLDRRDVDIDD